MSGKAKRNSKQQNDEEKIKKFSSPYEYYSDSDDDAVFQNEDIYVKNTSVFIQYDSDNDDMILNDDLVDTSTFSNENYDSDNEVLENHYN